VAVLDEENLRLKVPEPFVEGRPRRLTEAERIRYRSWTERFAITRRVEKLLDRGQPTPLLVSDEFVSYEFWSQDPPPEVSRRAVDVAWDAFRRMDAVLRARGARLAIVAIPTRQQVYSLDERGPGFDVRLPQALIEGRARAEQIPYLDLLPLLRRRAQADWRALYLTGDTHLGPHGHRVVGELVAQWFANDVRRRLPRPVGSPP
jgi:hypothetical protein